jgi:hypothetical protein
VSPDQKGHPYNNVDNLLTLVFFDLERRPAQLGCGETNDEPARARVHEAGKLYTVGNPLARKTLDISIREAIAATERHHGLDQLLLSSGGLHSMRFRSQKSKNANP